MIRFGLIMLTAVLGSQVGATSGTSSSQATKYSCLNALSGGEVGHGSINGYDGSQHSISGDETTFQSFGLEDDSHLYIATANSLKTCEVLPIKYVGRVRVAPNSYKLLEIDGTKKPVESKVIDPIGADTPEFPAEVKSVNCRDSLDNTAGRSNPMVQAIEARLKVYDQVFASEYGALNSRQNSESNQSSEQEGFAAMRDIQIKSRVRRYIDTVNTCQAVTEVDEVNRMASNAMNHIIATLPQHHLEGTSYYRLAGGERRDTSPRSRSTR